MKVSSLSALRFWYCPYVEQLQWVRASITDEIARGVLAVCHRSLRDRVRAAVLAGTAQVFTDE